MSSYRPVKALLRGLEVLLNVNRISDRVSVGEIHHNTGIDKATIVRMLETLVHAGYVIRMEDGPHYEVTGKALLLSSGYDRHRVVGNIVSPIMAEFRTKISWPSDVAIFEHNQMLVVETSRQAGPLLVNRHPGYRAPILGTSLGLAYLAFTDEFERETVLLQEAFDSAPWNDIARNKDLAGKMFAKIRSQGFAVMHPDYSTREYGGKIGTIGVPIFGSDGVFGAINILFLKNVLPIRRACGELLGPLQAVAKKISGELNANSDC
ncbi:MAG: helix-turn-helix domain-containing protein [Hyphomicrobiales bacterium]|nr:helix-turn-helix domain-containing protein [Hyphomicrobiales bacterium]